MLNIKKKLRAVLTCLGTVALLASILPSVNAGEFIKNCNIRIAGDDLNSNDASHLARYDVIFANKFHYDDIGDNSWDAVKSINPEAEFFTYYTPHITLPSTDYDNVKYLVNISRYNVDREHSMGSLNGDNPDFFLLDSSGNRITGTHSYTTAYRLDFGSADFQAYALEGTLADSFGHPWTADGIYMDGGHSIQDSISALPEKYDTDEKWAAAMNNMLSNLTAGLHEKGQKLAVNRGLSRLQSGFDAWIDLDAQPSPPDVLLEEGAFVVYWGPSDGQFFSEADWKRQVDTLRLVKNSKICFTSHTDLLMGESGVDNRYRPFSFWDALWYAIGSFLIGKEDNSYFFMRYDESLSDSIYFDEYDIDLGVAIGDYKTLPHNGVNIYWREYANGFAFVNPTETRATTIPLPEASKLLSHEVIEQGVDYANLPDVWSIDLDPKRAAILYKTAPDGAEPAPPPPPPGDELTMYEDAEDGLIDGWDVYDNDPAGATISNVFDQDLGSRVIELSGDGSNNGYHLRSAGGIDWQNTSQTIIHWSMKYSEHFTVYIDVDTTEGQAYLMYSPVDSDYLGSENVHHGLGRSAANGQWYAFERDLQADLEDGRPGVSILQVNGFLIRGSGRVDDIALVGTSLPSEEPGVTYEDAEDGSVSGWDIYDADPAGAVVSNVFADDLGSRVIELSGSGRDNGYRLRNDDGTEWQNATQRVIEWTMSFSERFTIYIDLETDLGQRYVTYAADDLGSNVTDGIWRTFVRDLQTDLEAAQPGATILYVNGFLVRGSGRLDDIRLLY